MVTIKIYLLKCRLFFFFWLFGTILFFVTFCFSLSPGDIVMLSCFNPDHSLSLSDRGRILQKKRGQRGGSFLLYIITSTKTKQGRTKSWVTIAVIIAFFLSPTTQTPQLLSANQRLFRCKILSLSRRHF